jgi:hypothetical protein
MVIDNIDHLEDQDEEAVSIQKYIPRRNGAILITSRDSQVSEFYVSNSEEIMIEVMSDQEATDMFFQLLENNDPKLLPGIRTLINLFGNLPLAIAQAASYIREMSQKKKFLHLQVRLLLIFPCHAWSEVFS